MNLLTNAHTYGYEGGVIRLTLEGGEREALFAVSDDGPGIPREEAERIFERFYRPDGEVVRGSQGSGLGLSIAKAMVELQRQISIDNDSRPAEHRLQVRIGVHFGPALTDGTLVSGDSVNFSARVAASAALSEIRLSVGAYLELSDVALRLRCRKLKSVSLKGIDDSVELMVLDWLDPAVFPASVRIDGKQELMTEVLLNLMHELTEDVLSRTAGDRKVTRARISEALHGIRSHRHSGGGPGSRVQGAGRLFRERVVGGHPRRRRTGTR